MPWGSGVHRGLHLRELPLELGDVSLHLAADESIRRLMDRPRFFGLARALGVKRRQYPHIKSPRLGGSSSWP